MYEEVLQTNTNHPLPPGEDTLLQKKRHSGDFKCSEQHLTKTQSLGRQKVCERQKMAGLILLSSLIMINTFMLYLPHDPLNVLFDLFYVSFPSPFQFSSIFLDFYFYFHIMNGLVISFSFLCSQKILKSSLSSFTIQIIILLNSTSGISLGHFGQGH